MTAQKIKQSNKIERREILNQFQMSFRNKNYENIFDKIQSDDSAGDYITLYLEVEEGDEGECYEVPLNMVTLLETFTSGKVSATNPLGISDFGDIKRIVDGREYIWKLNPNPCITEKNRLSLIIQSREEIYIRLGQLDCNIRLYLWLKRLDFCEPGDVPKEILQLMPQMANVISQVNSFVFFCLRELSLPRDIMGIILYKM
jgi:hypothetical protein